MLPENFNLIINLQIPQFEILLNFIPNPCQYGTTAATVRTDEQTNYIIKIIHICDFSRSVLNTRLYARIQHLLRGHIYGLF